MDRQELGSRTAKGGFQNEADIVDKFNDYQADQDAQSWLKKMGYNPATISSLKAFTIPPRINPQKAIELGATERNVAITIKYKKADIQLQIVSEGRLYRENLSLKKQDRTRAI